MRRVAQKTTFRSYWPVCEIAGKIEHYKGKDDEKIWFADKTDCDVFLSGKTEEFRGFLLIKQVEDLYLNVSKDVQIEIKKK